MAYAQPQATDRLFDGIDKELVSQIQVALPPADEWAKIESSSGGMLERLLRST